jgi:hypothetical protein
MSVIARRVVASPVRTASETWAVITSILAPKQSDGRKELDSVAGVACSLIGEESPAGDPIIVWGNGPRVRVYCLFGEDAITEDGKSEDALATCPTDGDWSMSLPCPEEELSWISNELARLSKRITARKLGDAVPDDDTTSQGTKSTTEIDQEAFFRP